jgi:hypothetical protein
VSQLRRAPSLTPIRELRIAIGTTAAKRASCRASPRVRARRGASMWPGNYVELTPTRRPPVQSATVESAAQTAHNWGLNIMAGSSPLLSALLLPVREGLRPLGVSTSIPGPTPYGS